ncbi:hypothetical protein SRHO_G00214740 [Serrasalmus rhombeus]
MCNAEQTEASHSPADLAQLMAVRLSSAVDLSNSCGPKPGRALGSSSQHSGSAGLSRRQQPLTLTAVNSLSSTIVPANQPCQG